MARISARLIGNELHKNAHEVNLMLEQIGLIVKSKAKTLSGSPIWDITDLGKLHGEPSSHPYSNGYIWDHEVVDILRDIFKL